MNIMQRIFTDHFNTVANSGIVIRDTVFENEAFGLLTYEEAYYPEYYDCFLCTNNTYHQDWLCKSFNHNTLLRTAMFLWNDEEDEFNPCSSCSPNRDIVLINEQEKLIHSTENNYNCTDFRTLHKIYRVASKQSALNAGYQLCEKCND